MVAGDDEHIVVAGQNVGRHRVILGDVDLDIDANLRQHVLDCDGSQRQVGAGGIGPQTDGQFAFFITGFRQQSFGFFWIIRIAGQVCIDPYLSW